MNTSVKIGNTTFAHPLLLASGPFGVIASGWKRLVTLGAAGITTKACLKEAKEGCPSPVVISTDIYTLSADGFAASGYDTAATEIIQYNQYKKAPLIVAVGGFTVAEFVENSLLYSALKPDILEIHLGFPNRDNNNIPFSHSVETAKAVIETVRKAVGVQQISAKLSADVPYISEIAATCAKVGSNFITAIDPIGPGLQIDLRSRLPILNNWTGGVSGPAIKPIAIRAVADIYEATNGTIPIIGTGGIQTGADALEMMIAGASVVAIGNAITSQDDNVFTNILSEMTAFCMNENIESMTKLTGSMHTAIAARTLIAGQKTLPPNHYEA